MRPGFILLALTLTAGCRSAPPATTPTPSPAVAPTATPSAQGYHLVIEGGRVVDGTGSAWFYGDLAVRGGRIVAITPPGRLRAVSATERLDATGLVVSPGFIDIQSHSREALLDGDGHLVSKITQGITTEIMGETGTNAPQNARTGGSGGHDFTGPRGFDRWLQAMQANGASTNFGSFVGATTVRMYAKCLAQGLVTPAELDTMRAVVRNAIQAKERRGLWAARFVDPVDARRRRGRTRGQRRHRVSGSRARERRAYGRCARTPSPACRTR